MKLSFESLRPLAWAALVCLVVQPFAHAETGPAKKQLITSVRVSYADLDLTQQADVDILLGRIKKAAFRACGGRPQRHIHFNVMPEHVSAVFKECREDAVARAINEAQTPALLQAYLATPAM